MRKRKKRVGKETVSGLGDEYDTILELTEKLGTYRGFIKTRCMVVDLRTGKRKVLDFGQPSVINRQGIVCNRGITDWKVVVPGTCEEDVLFMVMTVLRCAKRYTIRTGRGRPKHATRLKTAIPRNSFDKISAALKETGRVLCTDRRGKGFTVELFVPKWTGWTIKDVYGLSGEAVEVDITGNKKPVLQLDKKTGEVIRRFDCVKDAARAMGDINSTGKISACCKGKIKTCFGHRWRYADSNEYV